MKLFSIFCILIFFNGCVPPPPLNIGGSNYKFHSSESKSSNNARLFSTDIDNNSVVIFGRIKANMMDCFVDSGLPMVFYHGKGGLFAVKTGGLFKQIVSNLYPYSPGIGLVAFHITKDDLNKSSIIIKGYCSAITGTTSYYSTSYSGSYVNYTSYPLPDFVVKNIDLPFKNGNAYYFGDLEYKITKENKDVPGQYKVTDKHEDTYSALLKIMPEIGKLSPNFHGILPKI